MIQSPYVTKIKRDVAMTFTSYVANTGGLLGLCLGFSFISLVEICTLLGLLLFETREGMVLFLKLEFKRTLKICGHLIWGTCWRNNFPRKISFSMCFLFIHSIIQLFSKNNFKKKMWSHIMIFSNMLKDKLFYFFYWILSNLFGSLFLINFYHQDPHIHSWLL